MTGTPAAPPRPALPAGCRLILDSTLRRFDGGRALVGGSPLRGLRLTAAGAREVDGWAAGHQVGTSGAVQRLARRLVDAGLAHPWFGPPESVASPRSPGSASSALPGSSSLSESVGSSGFARSPGSAESSALPGSS